MLLLPFSSCAQRDNYTAKVIYDPPRHVIPSKLTDKWKREVGDSVVFFFEAGFSNDSLRISVGTKNVSVTLTSDQVLQYARYIVLPPPIDSESSVTFTINGGSIITVKPDSKRYFAINFVRNIVVVTALDDFPYYD